MRHVIPGLDSLFDQMKSISLKELDIKTFFRDKFTSIFYTASSGITSIAQLVSSFVIIKFVDPSELGVWNSVKLLTAYSFVILFGINNGLNRELPYSLGQNKLDQARRKTGVTLYYNILTSIILVVVGIGVLQILSTKVEYNLFLALAIILPYIILNHYNNYLTVTYRSKDSFNILSYIKLVESFLMLITILLVVQYGYSGMLLRSLLLLLFITLLMHVYRPIRVKPEWNKADFITLLKTGIPIFVIDYIKNISNTLAPIFVLKAGGFGMVGLFTLGTMAFGTITVIPSSITQYIYPKYSYVFGKHNNRKDLWKIGMRSMLLCSAMLIPVIIITFILVDPLVLKYFPKYSGGIPAAKIFILASFFNSISILTAVLLSLKLFKLLLINQLSFSMLLIFMPALCVKTFSNPVIGASIGVLIANVANFIIVMCSVYYSTHRLNPKYE
jgi:O-antigen/teichoic acid export membrane protein